MFFFFSFFCTFHTLEMWLYQKITCHTSFEYSYCGKYWLDQDCIKQRKHQPFRVKKCKIYLIMLLWFIFKHSFVVYLCKEHNARISSCAWNTFYLYFAYIWMLWYRSLTLCQMKQLWTVGFKQPPAWHPQAPIHRWPLLKYLQPSVLHLNSHPHVTNSTHFNRRDTCESIPHNLKAFCGSLPPQHTCRRIHIHFHLISLEPYICLIVGTRKV